jgi:hypothetical protein
VSGEIDRTLAELEAQMVKALAEPLAEPCWECACCDLWTERLEALRASAQFHVRGEVRLKPCHPDCLICGAVGWQNK